MHDILTNLKAKLAKQEKQYQDDNQQLSEDYKRITEQYIDLQKKSKYATNPVNYVFLLTSFIFSGDIEACCYSRSIESSQK